MQCTAVLSLLFRIDLTVLVLLCFHMKGVKNGFLSIYVKKVVMVWVRFSLVDSDQAFTYLICSWWHCSVTFVGMAFLEEITASGGWEFKNTCHSQCALSASFFFLWFEMWALHCSCCHICSLLLWFLAMMDLYSSGTVSPSKPFFS